MKKYNYLPSTVAGGIAVTLLAACSSSSDNSTTTPDANNPISVGTVEEALADFPNAFLPRFALSNDEVTAGEVFRQVIISDTGTQSVFWGVEGATEDELLELEALYADDGTLVESVRNERLDALPESIDSALRGRYPDAVINDIERSTTDSGVTYAILLDTMGEEIEANYDENAVLLFVEDVEERDSIPAGVLATADAQGVTLPDAEFEITTDAEGGVSYAVEYENDQGQSITIAMNDNGDITRIEHEDAMVNLSTSETVLQALADYPEGIEADFATMFSEVTAAEIFRSQDLSGSNGAEVLYGIEGLSEDESLEVEALYTADVILVEQGRGMILDALPGPVDTAFAERYPNVQIEEIVEVVGDQGTSYAVLFIESEREREANFAADGEFIAVEDILEENEIPAAILDAIGAERVLLPILEIEAVTAVDGSVSYGAEYENETGDSISYTLTSDGTILKIDHEAALTQ